MVDTKYYLNGDHFKIGHYGDKHIKRINIALVVSGIVIVITVIFYILMYSFTNFRALDDITETSIEFNQGKDKIMSEIEMAAKIMPSYNFKGNALWMKKTREVEDSIIPNALSLMESLNLNNTYMKLEKTKNFFPRFKYNEDNIPVGNSILLCVSLHWSTIEKGPNYDLSDPVEGFPVCSGAASGKMIWNVDDPKNGVDVPAWTQHEIDIDCTDEEDCRSTCDGYDSLFLNGIKGKKCFGYKILTSICLTVKWDEELSKFSYAGGCFENGNHYLMGKPEKDQIYHFDKIKFEVRNAEDPIIQAGKISKYTYSFGASLVGFLFRIG